MEICEELGLKRQGSRQKVVPRTKLTTDIPPYATQKIRGDGNCLFRTICHVITNSENEHVLVRQLICDQIQAEAGRYLGRVGSVPYLRKTLMRVDTAWGTDKEISAAADLLGTTIWSFAPFGDGRYGWSIFEPQNNSTEEAIYIVNRNSHYEPLYKW